MSKHTPGPWYVGPDNRIWRRSPLELYEYGGGVAGDSPIAAAFDGRASWVNKFPSEANARLIAAAPELLQALKKCAAVCAGETMNKNGLIEALEAARAAIRKATGE